MIKKLFFFAVCLQSFNSIAMAKEEQTLQIIANKVDQNGSIITAVGDLLIFSPNYFITAQKAVYDQNNSTMNLYGNVNISKESKTISLSNYAFLDMKNEISSVTPVLFIDKSANIWINAKTIDKKNDLSVIKDATLSSCDCIDPTWSIGFSSGDFNATNKWINTYNNTLYIYDIPAWYFLVPAIPYVSAPTLIASYMLVNLPYMGFSTDKTRRTGLLKPQIGYEKNSGFFYAQPIYYAPALDVDFEYIPQIRTSRGNGHELKGRYVDSAYSKLEFDAGIFNEKKNYYEEHKLINQKHYGWNLKYNRSKLFSNGDHSDGFYGYFQDMNDVDYLSTKYKSNNDTLYTNKILESKIKYFYNTQSYNVNSEVLHYNDISKNNNDDVMQVTPSLNLHKYSDSLFINNFRNNIDLKYKKQHRITGLGAQTTDITIPLSYSQSFLNDYFLFSYEKNFSLNKIDYLNNDNNQYKNGTLLASRDSISLEMDLLKSYETIIHTINFNAKYSKQQDIKVEGDIYGINSQDSNLSIFAYSNDIENINLTFNQSLFNKNNKSTLLNHKINQKIIYDPNGASSLDSLENELTLYFPYGSGSNRFLYNHDEKMIIKSTSKVNLSKDDFFGELDYSYSFDQDPTTKLYRDGKRYETISGNIGTKVLKYYTMSYKEQYDIANHISKLKEYKLGIDKKCWALDLSFQDSLMATATTDRQVNRQSAIYATITLKPIISFKQKYTKNEGEL